MLPGIGRVNKCLKIAQLCQVVGPKHTEKIGKNGQEKKQEVFHRQDMFLWWLICTERLTDFCLRIFYKQQRYNEINTGVEGVTHCSAKNLK